MIDDRDPAEILAETLERGPRCPATGPCYPANDVNELGRCILPNDHAGTHGCLCGRGWPLS